MPPASHRTRIPRPRSQLVSQSSMFGLSPQPVLSKRCPSRFRESLGHWLSRASILEDSVYPWMSLVPCLSRRPRSATAAGWRAASLLEAGLTGPVYFVSHGLAQRLNGCSVFFSCPDPGTQLRPSCRKDGWLCVPGLWSRRIYNEGRFPLFFPFFSFSTPQSKLSIATIIVSLLFRFDRKPLHYIRLQRSYSFRVTTTFPLQPSYF